MWVFWVVTLNTDINIKSKHNYTLKWFKFMDANMFSSLILNLFQTYEGLSVYITLIHHVHYFQARKCKHSTHFSFQGVSLLSSWPLSFSGAVTVDIRRKIYTMPLYDSWATEACHSNMCPFSLYIHKYTYLGPSHLLLTLFSLYKNKLWYSFIYLTSKSAGLLKDIWKNVFKTNYIIYDTVHLWAKFSRNN